jgi:hypothetical protein
MPMKTTSDPYADLAALFLADDRGRDEVAAAAVADAVSIGEERETDARERVELVLPGNLPVMGSLWIAQYADLIGRREGPTALCRVGEGEVTVEIFRAGTRTVGLDAAVDLEGAIRDLSGLVARWLVVPAEASELDVPPAAATATLLSGADDAATVGAYRLLKQLVERWQETSIEWPRFGLAVLGSDDGDASGVAGKLNRTARAFLNREIRVTATRQRMEPLESCARRTFATGTAGTGPLDAVSLCRTIVNGLRKERRRERAASREVAAPSIPIREAARPRPAAGFRLPPKPAAAPVAAAEPPLPAASGPLAARIAGLRPLPPRCPTARGIELACDAAGGLHLVATPASLAELPATSAWVRAQRELLALACPELRAPEGEPTRHVVADDPAAAMPLVGSGITVHLAVPGGSLVTLG